MIVGLNKDRKRFCILWSGSIFHTTDGVLKDAWETRDAVYGGKHSKALKNTSFGIGNSAKNLKKRYKKVLH